MFEAYVLQKYKRILRKSTRLVGVIFKKFFFHKIIFWIV